MKSKKELKGGKERKIKRRRNVVGGRRESVDSRAKLSLLAKQTNTTLKQFWCFAMQGMAASYFTQQCVLCLDKFSKE